MSKKTAHLFEEIYRHLLLARSKEKDEAEEHIDEVSKKVTKLKQIIEIEKEQKNEETISKATD